MQVRSVVNLKIEDLKKWLEKRAKKEKNPESKAHFFSAYTRILHFQDNPTEYKTYDPVDPPPGSPIGMGCGIGSSLD